MSRGRRVLAGLALAAALGASGCAADVPAPRPQEDAGPVPAVTAGQVDRVLEDLGAALAAGDAALDPAALQARVDGAALQTRLAGYAVRAGQATAAQPAPLVGEQLLEAVPASGPWPRWFTTVTEPTDGAVPQLLVLTQAGPRDPYRLTSSATLLPGTTLPELALQDGVALTAAASDAAGLSASPADALAHYADVLTGGGASQWAAGTADDALRQQVTSEQDAERAAVSQYFAYAVAHTPREGAAWALRTQDGGALVVGVLDATRTFTPNAPGIRQVLPEDLAVLAGRPDAPSGSTVTTATAVALHVPPAGSDQQLRLVAASRGLVGIQVA
ncbi:hypothetical protein [Quadrisphaera sp. DSM 44207]|uniref:hypothetical protein n=1 Tax=Quadrisphaera sp. DSM 44207 TaxID=1881057 RepID=UPI000886EB36|nr:hypothetical protein [Quadrisphaera sp. DSM 44207]SDQ73997.1 hypothetical protein SAMN05428996_2618 [Quadrisphaera sp. DSM 44207]